MRPGARLATEKISRLWELAVERSGNPALGLAQHQVVRPASFDVVGYTMLSCENLRGAFERLVRYLLILSDALTYDGQRLSAADTEWTVRALRRRPAGAAAAHRVHFQHRDRLLPLDQRARGLSGRGELAYPHPAELAPYRAAFRCPVTFDAPRNSLQFAAADMTRAAAHLESTARRIARALRRRIPPTLRSRPDQLPGARGDHSPAARR
jgi:hypothetical protein